jgi:DNA ligase-1
MIQIISKLRKMSGNAQIEEMKKHPKIKGLIRLAYDPFIKFYMTGDKVINGHGMSDGNSIVSPAGTLDPEGRAILISLHKRELSGSAAFEALCDYIATLTPDSIDLLRCILNKDLRLGVGVKGISKAFPGLIKTADNGEDRPPIMLCKTLDLEKVVYPVVAAVKKDGTRGRVAYGESRIQTRAGHSLKGLSHLEEELDQYVFEKDGEVVVPGMIFDEGSGKVRSDDETPDAVFFIFDVPNIQGDKLTRLAYMRENIKETDHVKIVEHRTCTGKDELVKFYEEALSAGEEGLVVYKIEHDYRDARSMDWCRMCPKKSADCRVIGFEEGKGKLEGSLGKIVVEFPGEDGAVHEVKVGTGFVEKEWDDLTPAARRRVMVKHRTKESYEAVRRGFIWENRKHFFGMIAEIDYKERTKAGSMRQPRFKGWRFDKNETSAD